jgi:hypothetical protein
MPHELVDAPLIRILVLPSEKNGLRMSCQIGVDERMTVKREKIGGGISEMGQETMLAVDRATPVFWATRTLDYSIGKGALHRPCVLRSSHARTRRAN